MARQSDDVCLSNLFFQFSVAIVLFPYFEEHNYINKIRYCKIKQNYLLRKMIREKVEQIENYMNSQKIFRQIEGWIDRLMTFVPVTFLSRSLQPQFFFLISRNIIIKKIRQNFLLKESCMYVQIKRNRELFAKLIFSQRYMQSLLIKSRNQHALEMEAQPPHMTFRLHHIEFS